MEKPAEISTISDSRVLGLLRSETESMTGKSAAGYKKAVASVCNFALGHPELESASSAAFLCDWMAAMSLLGLTVKTSVHYLDLVSSLCSSAAKRNLIPSTDAFRVVKARVAGADPDVWNTRITEDDFERFSNFTKFLHSNRDSYGESEGLFADIILFSLINNAMSLADIAKLKYADLSGCASGSEAIAQRYADSRRRYVFPLEQSRKTPRQLENYVTVKVAQLLLSRNITVIGSVGDTIKSYWALAALKSGVSAASVVRTLGSAPCGVPVLGICEGMQTDAGIDAAAARTIASIFLSDPVEWYAMRLRPGVEYDTLLRRLSALKKDIPLFYPMEEISRRAGRRIICKDVPVLPGIVFFRSRLTAVSPLFAHIGDIAWCYKAGDAYSPIPLYEMERFQQAIGTFTSETEILPAGSIKPGRYDRVEILGGMFTGCTAEFDSERTESAPRGAVRTIYRLLFSSDNGIEWVVELDSRLVRKVPDSKQKRR